MKVKGAESRYLFGLFPIPMKPAPFWFRPVFPLRAALSQNPFADIFQRIILAKVAHELAPTGIVEWADRDVLTHLDVVSHLPQAIKKLPFRHRLADGSIHIGFDKGEIGGATFLFGPPFPVVLRFSMLGMFNDGKAIFPAQTVRFLLHIEVILFGAVILDPVDKRNRVHYKMIVQVVGFV